MLSLVGSSVQGCYLLVSPAVTLALNHFGYKWTVLGGVLLSFLSIGTCFLNSDIFWAFAMFYGVTNGLGMGFMSLAANTVTPMFFKKKTR